MNHHTLWTRIVMLSAALFSAAIGAAPMAEPLELKTVSTQLQVGDVVFIRIPHAPFTKVADSTMSWTNHVGIVSDVSGAEPVIAESRVPVSGETTLSKFVQRSEQGRVVVTRLGAPLDAQQQQRLKQAVAERDGILYDTGFDLHSKHQFCSRYVREVLDEAAGVKLGEIETFANLLKRNPDADRAFWKAWYFGSIPWQRETVTPASLLNDKQMQVVFDGKVQ